MKRYMLLIAATGLALAGCDDSTGPDEPRRFEVTIRNLTSTQPLTPPVVVTHGTTVELYDVGQAATQEVREVAENGNLTPLVDGLTGAAGVSEVVTAVAGDPPPLLPGDDVTITITSEAGVDRLSFISMLICTNDGFTGVDGLDLPDELDEQVVMETDSYDAGTEMNTEDFSDMVPPCPVLSGVETGKTGTGVSDPALAENGVIHGHQGIQGGVDLTAQSHGWQDPTAEITVRRTG